MCVNPYLLLPTFPMITVPTEAINLYKHSTKYTFCFHIISLKKKSSLTYLKGGKYAEEHHHTFGIEYCSSIPQSSKNTEFSHANEII